MPLAMHGRLESTPGAVQVAPLVGLLDSEVQIVTRLYRSLSGARPRRPHHTPQIVALLGWMVTWIHIIILLCVG
jgi:hypothetical protein